MKQKKICEHCGASMMEYRHGLTKNFATVLMRMYKAGEANIGNMCFTISQFNNFQKLAYFGLIESVKKGSGLWRLTGFGARFIEGKAEVRKYAWTFRGKVIRLDGPLVKITDLTETDYKKRREYAAEAEAQEDDRQAELF